MPYTPTSQTGVRIGNTDTTILACPSGKQLYIKTITLHNTSDTDVACHMWIAPNDGGSVRTVAEADVYSVLVPLVEAYDTINITDVGFVLAAENDAIIAVAETDAVVNCIVTYTEITA